METQATILLVEDNLIVAQHERMVLREHGFAVLVARSGEEAIDEVRRNDSIDLVLMDIELGSGMDGIAAARRISSIGDVPVVFLTSRAERVYLESVEEIASYGYVLKETSEFNLVQTIRTAVHLHESQRTQVTMTAHSYHEALERKNEELRAARAFLERGEELAGLGSWEWDIASDTWTMSPNFYRIHGIRPRSMTSEELFAVAHPDDRTRIWHALHTAKDNTGRYDVEHRIVREDTGAVRTVHSIGEVEISRETGEAAKIIGSVQDVTDLKEAARLEAELEQRNRILQELNHRIKNNLAMVSSLISLKDRSLGDEVDLSDIRHQVDAIAFIFDRLRESDGFTHIQVEPYVEELLDAIFSFYPGGPVEVAVAMDRLLLPSKAATSIGLIVNELATNAMKHGFTSDGTPSFAATLERSDTEYTLTVSNSGRTLPEEIDIEGGETLGLRLVSALVAGVGGRMEISRAPTPEFTIRFPVP